MVQVLPSGVEVTVYDSTGRPPSLSGGCHDTSACSTPAVAVTERGAPGMVPGVTSAGSEGTDAPLASEATTVTA